MILNSRGSCVMIGHTRTDKLLNNSILEIRAAQITYSHSCRLPALGLKLRGQLFFPKPNLIHSSQNLKTSRREFLVFLLSSPIKCEANRSRGLRVMIGNPSKQSNKQKLQLYIYRYICLKIYWNSMFIFLLLQKIRKIGNGNSLICEQSYIIY